MTESTFLEANFVGESRHQIVDGLVKVFNECRVDATPRWVSLEGPSGCGKSRVVREFYSRIAKSQPSPSYWPDSLVSREDLAACNSVHIRRKQVYPKWSGSPGAWPSYMWWGIPCAQKHGTASETLANVLSQFENHAEPLDKAYAEYVNNSTKLSMLMKSSKQAFKEEGTAELLEKGIEHVLEEVPGLGMAIRTSKWAWNRVADYQLRETTIELGKSISDDPAIEPADEAVATIKALADQAAVPVIIFVEDLHDVDAAMVSVIERLLRGHNLAVMVITTTWVAELEQREVLYPLIRLFNREWLLGNRFHRVTEVGPDAPDSPVQGSFSKLRVEYKVKIIQDYVPAIDTKTAVLLAEQYEQPLLLELVLASNWLKQDYGQALENLSAEAVADLPLTIDNYYTIAWERLPVSAKDTLIYGAIGVPHLIDPDSIRQGREWSLCLLSKALRTAKISHTMVESFSQEPRILGWVRNLDDKLSEFREWHHLSYAADKTTVDRRIKILEALASHACDEQVANLEGFGKSNYVETLILALASTSRIGSRHLNEKLISDRAVVAEAAKRKMYTIGRFPREAKEAIRLGYIYLNNVTDNCSEESLRVRDKVAIWTDEIGDTEHAYALYQSLLPDAQQELGDIHPVTLRFRLNYAGLFGKTSNTNNAISLLQQLIPDLEEVLGKDHPTTLIARNNFASCMGRAGNVTQALTLFRSLLSDQIRVYGFDYPDTLSTRNNLAYWTGKNGDDKAALALLKGLLHDRVKSQGADHPDNLTVRKNIADWTNKVGDAIKSLKLFEELLLDEERILGPDHPEALTSRGHLALINEKIGNDQTSFSMYQALLSDRNRVLGSKHIETLKTRYNLAALVTKTGDLEKGLSLYQKLVRDQELVLGADHSDTLRTRNRIAVYSAEVGDPTQSLALLVELLQDQKRILGEGHVNTLNSRFNIAVLVSNSGYPSEAIDILQALLNDQRSFLGATHTSTLETQSCLESLSARLKDQ